MSRSFNGTSDAAYCLTVPTSGVRVSLSCWVYPTSLGGTEQVVFAIGHDNGVTGDGFAIEIYTSNNWAILIPGKQRQDTGQAASLNTWQHVMLTVDNTGKGQFYFNGSAVGSTSSSTPNTPTVGVSIGAQLQSNTPTFFRYFTGRIAEPCCWNIDLTGTGVTGGGEAKALSLGPVPRRFRPGSLAGYWPMWGLHSPEPDMTGNANNLTLSGTAAANHAPVTNFTPKWINLVDGSLVGGPVPRRSHPRVPPKEPRHTISW
jgi:hypothetical protein